MQEKKFNLADLLLKNQRYVDDLATINYLYFQMIIEDIYPESLQMERVVLVLKIKNINDLDLNINITL